MNHCQPSPPLATPAAAWKQRYEALRQTALAGGQALEAEPFGLVLLARQGVAAWMHSWPQPAETQSREPALSPPSLPPPPQWQQQLTTLLAQMSLAHLPTPPL
ncbi:MAG: hypothetical protein M1608_02475 [Candidatus Omnitrophica bacterium]|nr:hypothetical protein [Candidatus Omnitrophota bacterium]